MNHIHDSSTGGLERVPAWLASECEEEKSRWKMRVTPNGEATIPFVPFQSEIAYNVEIKRSPPGRSTSGASEVAVRASRKIFRKMGVGYRNPSQGFWPGSRL